MKAKSKWMKYSLAAAIVSTSFAGIPFSEKGLVNHFAAQSANAAELSYNDQAIARFNQVYGALSAQGKLDVEAARQAITQLSSEQRLAIAGPIADKFNVSAAERGVLANLVVDLLSVSTTLNASALDGIRNNSAYRDALKSAAAAASFDPSGLTVEAVAKLAVNAEGWIGQQLKSKSPSELLALAGSASERNALISEALVQASSASDVEVLREYFQTIGVTGSELSAAINQLRTEITPTVFDKASMAIAAAYLVSLTDPTPTPTPDPNSDNTPVLSGGPQQSSIDKELDKLTEKLSTATEAEKQKLVEQALELFKQSVKDADKLNVASQITVTNGQATVDPSAAVIAKLDTVIKAAASLQKFLNAAHSDAKIPVDALVIDLGNIENKSLAFKLSEDAMKKLNASPFGKLNIAVNGLTLSVPNSSEFGKSFELTVATKDQSSEPALEGITSVSSVYSFDLKLGGQAVHEFANPIVLRIPLGNLDGVDKELLSVAKIVDGKLEFQGGVLDGNAIVEPRSTFSSYVVVENKLSFSDIGSVQSWAGRQIEVLAAKGAISGRSEQVFDPKGSVTRAEFAKMLVRALNLESSGLTSSFKDVKSTDWFAPYVAVAAKQGIITGRSADQFAPNATITRAEMATMIARALRITAGIEEVENAEEALKGFGDAASIHASLKAGVALAASEGIILGSNGKFNPNNNASRAEAAVILYRALQVK